MGRPPKRQRTSAEVRAELEEIERIEAEEAALAEQASEQDADSGEPSYALMVERDRLKKENDALVDRLEKMLLMLNNSKVQEALTPKEPPVVSAQPIPLPTPTPVVSQKGFSKSTLALWAVGGVLVGVLLTLLLIISMAAG